jgi:hypothetical protein
VTIYISRFFPYEHVIQQEVSRYEFVQALGDHQKVIVQPGLTAVFHRGAIPYAAREQAQAVFDAKFGSANGEPPGPYRRAGVAADPDFEGFMYDASEEPLFYSQFNTETDCPMVPGMTPAEVKARFEEVLSASGDLQSVDMIRVEQPRLAAPWATYSEISTGAGHDKAWVAKRIVELVEATGSDPARVAAFERENEDRDYVLVALAALAKKREQARAEIEALSA